MADRFFKRPNGSIVKTSKDQDADTLKSWEDRFEECDKNGSPIKKEKAKAKAKPKKKAKKEDK